MSEGTRRPFRVEMLCRGQWLLWGTYSTDFLADQAIKRAVRARPDRVLRVVYRDRQGATA